MHQKTDLLFQKMLKRVRNGKLDFRDIRDLNQRLAIELLILSTLNTVVIVQKNKTCYLVNRLQIEKFPQANNQDIIIFPIEYYKIKKDSDNLIQYELLF